MKRVLVISDLHCGAHTGLTPFPWQTTQKQADAYNMYYQWVTNNGPYDHVIVNGDAIDGTDSKGGGVEAITTDRIEQCKIAEVAIREAGCKSIHIIAGTPYHVGNAEDFESVLAVNLGATFKGHGFYNIEGIEFNIKHKVGTSSLPHLKLAPLAKEILQNKMWYLEGVEPKADVLIRSHTHSYSQVDSQGCIAFVTPALQSMGNRYGSRQCTGVVNFGLIIIDVHQEGIQWKVCLDHGSSHKTKSIIL